MLSPPWFVAIWRHELYPTPLMIASIDVVLANSVATNPLASSWAAVGWLVDQEEEIVSDSALTRSTNELPHGNFRAALDAARS